MSRPSGITPGELLAAMNRERAVYGLQPLHLSAQLSCAASDRVNDMFEKQYFDHVSPDGIDPFTWADRRGYDYREIGENLAVGYRTAASVVDGWMHSSAHRNNILKPAFREIGIATAAASPTHKYIGPLVVAMYGTR
ncbi:MAG TPA: CAP domain-containing protein [Thermoanaerobaculia bacterium]|nr:CAP domain-containing protein [Thermoanaerobaculia bacterium]